MTDTFTRWLQWALGIDPAETGEGTQWTLEAPGAWNPETLFLFAVAAVAFVVWIYLREGSAGRLTKLFLAGIRLAIIAVVLFMLFGVQLSVQRTRLPYLVVAIDDSASMGEADGYDDKTLQRLIDQRIEEMELGEPNRINQAKSWLLVDSQEHVDELMRNYKLIVYSMSTTSQRRWDQSEERDQLAESIRNLSAAGEQSRLGNSVRQILKDLRGTPPSAIVLLTDGVTTEGESLSEVARYSRSKGVPLFAVGLGSERPERDVAVTNLLVDDVVFVDDIVYFEFTVTAKGITDRQKVTVRLREKDQPETLAEMEIEVDPETESLQVRLPYRPTQVGDFDYVIELVPLEGERQVENNKHPPRRVSVRKERIRVLMVESIPRFEFRYLKSLLERDTTVELETVLQGADPEYAALDRSALRVFPVSREELFKYEVIIFGDVNPAFLNSTILENLSAFVKEKGGGIIFVAGPKHTPLAYRDTPLADLFPVDLNGAHAPSQEQPIENSTRYQLTDLGWASPHMQLGDSLEDTRKIWTDRLQGYYWYLRAPHTKPGARVLVEHPTETGAHGDGLPIFCLQYVGSGMVLFHATDDTWRWRYKVGDVYFARYWVQAIRYLSRNKLLGNNQGVRLSTDREFYDPGEPVRITAQFADLQTAPDDQDAVTVMIERQQSKTRLSLSRSPSNATVFEGTFREPVPGMYHVWMASPSLPGQPPTTDFRVNAPQSEQQQLQLDRTELQRAAFDTGGRYYDYKTSSNLIADLRELAPGNPVPDRSEPPISLWNWWPVWLLFLGLILTEWILRKRKGML